MVRGFRLRVRGFGVLELKPGCGLGFEVSGLGFEVSRLVFEVLGLGFEVRGLGFALSLPK